MPIDRQYVIDYLFHHYTLMFMLFIYDFMQICYFLLGIPSSFLDTTLNDIGMDLICQRTDKKYRHLALELGLEPSFINRTVLEKSTIIERTRKFLIEWRFSCGEAATYREIGQAIVEIGMDIGIIHECYRG